MTLAELTPEWAQKVLTATTRSHEQGRRQTYIYLHDLLYPSTRSYRHFSTMNSATSFWCLRTTTL